MPAGPTGGSISTSRPNGWPARGTWDPCSPADLDDDAVEELGAGIATALGLYAELGLQSCNMALYGAPSGTAGYWLNLRIACRSNLRPLYRSDATYFERLHWEGAVDLSPEDLAERAGDRFRR